MSDSGLFQRTFPDGIVDGEELGDRFRAAMHKNSGNPVDEEAAARLMKEIGEKDSLMYDFIPVSYTHLDVYKRQADKGVDLSFPYKILISEVILLYNFYITSI